MSSTDWSPLSLRRNGSGPQPLIEGVPAFLADELQSWVRPILMADSFHSEMRLRLRRQGDLRQLSGAALLDLADAVLYWRAQRQRAEPRTAGTMSMRAGPPPREAAETLEAILSAAGSAWRVNDARDGLERRVDDTVTAAAQEAARSSTQEASDHLATAWAAAYGRNPDPDKAYDEAVLAVEAVACPLVSPKNHRATLTTVIRDLRNQLSKWELTLTDRSAKPAPIDGLLPMLELLAAGQSRHAGSPNSRRQTQIEGESAVHLAATLVQWLSRGCCAARRPPSSSSDLR